MTAEILMAELNSRTMPLASATRLGPYEIVAPLGAGGMGEVYRARDTRLGREVALKVLPPLMALDPARRARFEQEARAAAALSHPNIVGLHDVGEAGDVFYIVSELVPGETLGAIVERGPVPVKKLLDIAVQIADGMAAAHAARITHRDLKPANIMVTPDGRAKILDFGLAKQAAMAAATPDETLTVMQQTEPGMIMGTVAYMSPEQARGKPADHRSDQFSFGLMLYEMAAGRKAFDRPEAVQVMSAILTEEPAPIERNIPAPLGWAIDRCLAKDPADRYESTRDLYQDLRHVRDHLAETTMSQATAAAPKTPKRRIRWQWPVIGVLGLAAAAGAGLYLSSPKLPDQSRYRFTPFAFDPIGQSMPIWSPDGKAVAYAGYVAAPQPDQVFVRYLDSPAPIQITSGPDSRRASRVGPGRQTHHLSELASTGGSLVGFGGRRRAGELHADRRNPGPGGIAGSAHGRRHAGGRRRRECGLDQFAAGRHTAEVPAESDGHAGALQRDQSTILPGWQEHSPVHAGRQGPHGGLADAVSAEPLQTAASGPDRSDALWRHAGVFVDARQPSRGVVLRVFARVSVAALDGRHGIATNGSL